MAKASVKIPYDPANIDFWTSNWALRAAREALESRIKLERGDELRAILVKEDDEKMAILQGEEVEWLWNELMGTGPHDHDPVATELIRRLKPLME